MSIVFTILILYIVGTLGAWQPDIDFNRVQLISNKESLHRHTPRNTHSRRSIFPHKFRHDNDHRSSGLNELRSPKYLVSDPPSTEQTPLKVHQPREDPRLFYQSDTYAKEVNANSLNNEVTGIYPGRDVVRADEDYYNRRPFPVRLRERETNVIPYDDICVTCPRDRTLIARPGSDRVRLQHPRLTSCHGYRVPREVKFMPMYGPKFGSLLSKGSYGILGQIKQRNEVLRYCYIKVDVLIQTCAVPKYLIADCRDENKTCSFTCRDTKSELHGPSSLTCGEDLKWIGQLPSCLSRRWCEPLPPPPHGRVSCKGDTVKGWGLAEGTACRLKCARGWISSSSPVAVCRAGSWTHGFSCVHKST